MVQFDPKQLGVLSAGAQIVFCLTIAIVNTGTFITDGVVAKPHEFKFGWILNFLTMWNLVTQALYMWFSAYTAFRVWSDLRHTAALGSVEASASLGAGSLQEPWHELDPEEAARPVSGYCGRCLSAAGNSRTDVGWTRFASQYLSPTTQTLLEHRDRWAYLVVTVGTFVGIGFWCVLFPHPSVRDTYFTQATAFATVRTVLDHGWTTATILADSFLIRHRGDARVLWGALLAGLYGGVYTLWNVAICAPINGRYAYPSIQVTISHLHPALQVLMYCAQVISFVLAFCLLRWVLTRYWRAGNTAAARRQSDVGLDLGGVAPKRGGDDEGHLSRMLF